MILIAGAKGRFLVSFDSLGLVLMMGLRFRVEPSNF